MRNERCKRLFRLILYSISTAVGFGLAPSAKADFLVTVDTSSLPSGTQGVIDIQFGPSPLGSPIATAAVTNFSTDATLETSVSGTDPNTGLPTTTYAGTDGGGSGTLPGTLSISNTSAYAIDDVYQPVTYGTYFSFDVSFSGSLDNAGTFAVTLYANDFQTTLLTIDPNGTVADINFNPDGSTTTQKFQDSNGNYDASILLPSAGPAAPAPPAWLLLSTGAIGMWAMRTRLGMVVTTLAARRAGSLRAIGSGC